MNDDLYALWLSQINELSFKKQLLLINAFPLAKAIFNATKYQLDSVKGLSESDIINIMAAQNEKLLRKHENLLAQCEITFVGIQNEKYPTLLKQIPDPPLGLYVLGELPDDYITRISIIGSRKSSDYGLEVAYSLSKDLAANGVIVVSGMARGIDSMAHKGALDGGGKTIAVLGCGVDVCYPPENKALMDRISKNGCVISEYYPGVYPIPINFPRRNRIISGLCVGTVVVEASDKSGTLITTNHALEQGREVMAVPGNVTSKLSRGTNELIKDGAAVVLDYKDVLNTIGLEIQPTNIIESENSENANNKNSNNVRKDLDNKAKSDKTNKVNNSKPIIPSDLSTDEKFVYLKILETPMNIDELIQNSEDVDPKNMSSALMLLEIKGYIRKASGYKYTVSNQSAATPLNS
ncbi:MAG: DNA-processing protein DprA [Defluviitaleaceae bacterium]|nr:DNA-processing protein DprA [Defluviitaleaceae bacterium]